MNNKGSKSCSRPHQEATWRPSLSWIGWMETSNETALLDTVKYYPQPFNDINDQVYYVAIIVTMIKNIQHFFSINTNRYYGWRSTISCYDEIIVFGITNNL